MSKQQPSQNKSEELVDPWALPAEPAVVATPAAVAPRQPPAPAADNGKVDYSCLIPAGVGAVMGSAGGAMINAFGRQPAMAGAVQGSATMVTVSAISCYLIKQRDGTIYDHSYDRTIAYSAGAAVWPMTGELFRTVMRQPVLSPAVALQRAFSCAIGGAIFGGTLDYFGWFRPVKPVEPVPASKNQ